MRVHTLLIVVTLVGVGVLGNNYIRNTEKETRETRPYGAYSDAELQAMILGVRSDVKKLSEAYEKDKAMDSRSTKQASMHGNIRELERVQEATRRVRGLGQELSQLEALLGQLEIEMTYRMNTADKVQTLIRRATTFQ